MDILMNPANSWEAFERQSALSTTLIKTCLVTGYGAIGKAVASAGTIGGWCV